MNSALETKVAASGSSSFSVVAVALARQWRLVTGIPFLAGVVVAVVLLLTPNSYRAVTSFIPEVRGRAGAGSGSLAGLAAAAGLSIGAVDAGETPQFYADLVKSTPVADHVLRLKVPGRKALFGRSEADLITLLDFLAPGSDPMNARLEHARENLRSMTEVALIRQTGVIEVAVMAPNPMLAAVIANEYVRQLVVFNVEFRQTKARRSRQFAELQVAEAERALTAAEDSLSNFVENNRSVSSPLLRLDQARLERKVQVRQELFVSLNRDLESSRIREADETPALNVIALATEPAFKAAPKRRQTVVASIAAAFILTASWVVFAELRSDWIRAIAADLRLHVAPELPIHVVQAWLRSRRPR